MTLPESKTNVDHIRHQKLDILELTVVSLKAIGVDGALGSFFLGAVEGSDVSVGVVGANSAAEISFCKS